MRINPIDPIYRTKKRKRENDNQKKAYYAKVAEQGCQINNSDCGGKLELHHPTGAGMALKANDYDVIPLCFNHHSAQTPLGFGHSVHKGIRTFEANYGTQEYLLTRLREKLTTT